MNSDRYSYYAFISYNHKDEHVAKWVQDSLENFKLPTTLKRDYGSRIPDHLRPIFRDATDLNAGLPIGFLSPGHELRRRRQAESFNCPTHGDYSFAIKDTQNFLPVQGVGLSTVVCKM